MGRCVHLPESLSSGELLTADALFRLCKALLHRRVVLSGYGYDDEDDETEEEVEGYFRELLRNPAAEHFTTDQVGDLLGEALMRRDTGCLQCLLKSPQALQLSPGKVEQIMGRDPRIRGISITNYQLPNGPIRAGRRWGQRHPQGANLGSNGVLKLLSKTHTMAATSPP